MSTRREYDRNRSKFLAERVLNNATDIAVRYSNDSHIVEISASIDRIGAWTTIYESMRVWDEYNPKPVVHEQSGYLSMEDQENGYPVTYWRANCTCGWFTAYKYTKEEAAALLNHKHLRTTEPAE